MGEIDTKGGLGVGAGGGGERGHYRVFGEKGKGVDELLGRVETRV